MHWSSASDCNIEDSVMSVMLTNALFIFWTAILNVKYDIYTNWISNTFLVRYAYNYLLIRRFDSKKTFQIKLDVSIQKSSKDAKLGQCLYRFAGPPLLWAELMHRSRTNFAATLIVHTGSRLTDNTAKKRLRMRVH